MDYRVIELTALDCTKAKNPHDVKMLVPLNNEESTVKNVQDSLYNQGYTHTVKQCCGVVSGDQVQEKLKLGYLLT